MSQGSNKKNQVCKHGSILTAWVYKVLAFEEQETVREYFAEMCLII